MQTRRHLVTSVVDATMVLLVVVVVVLLVDVLTGGLIVTKIGGRGRVTMSSTQSRMGPPAMLLMSV